MEQVPEERQPLLGGDRQLEEPSRNPDLEQGFGNFDQNGAGEDGHGDGGEEGNNNKSWRESCAEKLESKRLHRLVITLIAIDGACVLADLIYSFLSEECSPPANEDYLPPWLQLLSYLSLTITTLFLIEIPISLWAFGPKFYNPIGPIPHSSLHLFDASIIVTTFVLEAVLRGREREIAGLLVFLRLWRLVKLVGGLAVEAGELNEDMAMRMVEKDKQLKEKSEEIDRLRSENNELRARLGYSSNNDNSDLMT